MHRPGIICSAFSPRARRRQPLTRRLKRERIVHDLAEAEKHCDCSGKKLRRIAEETSERYEYIPAPMKVIQDVCLKYVCDCTVRTGTKPPQPMDGLWDYRKRQPSRDEWR